MSYFRQNRTAPAFSAPFLARSLRFAGKRRRAGRRDARGASSPTSMHFPKASSDRIALYKVFARLFTSVSIRVPQEASALAWEQRAAANLTRVAPRPRQAFLLVAVEGFSDDEAAEILDAERGGVLRPAAAGEQRDFAPGGDRHPHHRGRAADRHGHRGDGGEPRPPGGRHGAHARRGDGPVPARRSPR